MSINFPFCGNHVEWRRFSIPPFFFVILLAFPPFSCHGFEPMNEICDWLCPSISRYVGTMLNGTDSHLCCHLHSFTLFSPLDLLSSLFGVSCVSYLSSCLLFLLIIHIHRPPSSFLSLVCRISHLVCSGWMFRTRNVRRTTRI